MKGRARFTSSQRTLLLLALVCIAPVVASYAAYYGLRPGARTNYGELVDALPLPEATGRTAMGERFNLSDLRGKWVLLTVDDRCDERCARKLYATRQSRLMQGKEQQRIVRLWSVPEGTLLPPDAAASQPGLLTVHLDAASVKSLAGEGIESGRIALIDPLGNLVMRYGDDADIKGIARDLGRLLRASRIG